MPKQPRQSHVIIDPEFKSLITPLTAEEKNLLEESIKREGCRDPLVTWRGILVDGHHRYQICTRLNLRYSMTVLPSHQVKTREEAKVWIIRNQFARRNLHLFQRVELALQMEEIISARSQQGKRNDFFQNSGKSDPLHTDKELAKIAAVSHDTIHKGRVIAERAPEATKDRLRRGETTIYREYRRIVYKDQQESQRSALLESASQNTSPWTSGIVRWRRCYPASMKNWTPSSPICRIRKSIFPCTVTWHDWQRRR